MTVQNPNVVALLGGEVMVNTKTSARAAGNTDVFLNVYGEVAVQDGAHYAVGASKKTVQLLSGRVTPTGVPLAGSFGFTVEQTGVGIYRVYFDVPFLSTPSVTVAVEDAVGFATTNSVDTDGVIVTLYTPVGLNLNALFSIQVIGVARQPVGNYTRTNF